MRFHRSRATAVTVSSVLCGLGAAGCSVAPSILMSRSPPGIAAMSLTVDTVPSGAQARIRHGVSCQTPCELTVTPMGPFVVDITLKNYEPQSAEVVLAASNSAEPSAGVRLDPNPLIVQLTPIARPSPPAKHKPVAKQPVPKSAGPETAGAIWPASPSR